MNIELKIPLKDDRTYLHGTDIYNALVNYFYKSGWKTFKLDRIKLKFHHLAHNTCYLVLSDSGKLPYKYSTEFNFRFKDRFQSGWLVESNKPITHRVMSYESAIYKQTLRKGSSVSLLGSNVFPPIECLVFMTKKLHYDLIPTPKDKSWYFAALDSIRFLEQKDTIGMEIKLLNVFQSKFSESEIIIGKKRFGTIYFALA